VCKLETSRQILSAQKLACLGGSTRDGGSNLNL
jgi:hypothetical protein